MHPARDWVSTVPMMPATSWRKITDDPRPAMKIGGGDLPVPRVDPQNPDVVYSTSIVTCKSTDGGKTWISLRGAPGGDDYQNLWINPRDPRILLLVSDQGAVISVNGGESWSSWYNQPTAQLYHVAATNDFPYQVCAGQQESGSVCTSTRGNDGQITFREWHPVGIIEYGYAAPDPLHPGIIYGAGRTQVSRYDSGDRSGAERDADSHAQERIPCEPHRADPVLARRSAHDVLRCESPLRHHGWRFYMEDDQPRSEPGDDWSTIHRANSYARPVSRTPRRDLFRRRVLQERANHLGGHGRRPGLDHEGRRRELDENHAARCGAVEQDRADRRIALR